MEVASDDLFTLQSLLEDDVELSQEERVVIRKSYVRCFCWIWKVKYQVGRHQDAFELLELAKPLRAADSQNMQHPEISSEVYGNMFG